MCGLFALTVGAYSRRAFAKVPPEAVGKLVDLLANAPSYKVRIEAAALLARVREPRAYQALGRAAVADREPSVRIVALKLLARNPGGDATSAQQARQAIGRALGDGDRHVRSQAVASLAQLDRSSAPTGQGATHPGRHGPLVVAVGNIGDRTGHAPRNMRDKMKVEIRNLLARQSAIKVADVTATPGVSFIVDGTIRKLDTAATGPDMEATCAVELVVSRPPRGIVTVASGEAVVQKPRRQFLPQHRPQMEEEAMANAVRSAHDSLAQFLASQ